MLHGDRAKAKSQISKSSTLKILLADDQKFVQRKLQQMLSSKANLQVIESMNFKKVAFIITINFL